MTKVEKAAAGLTSVIPSLPALAVALRAVEAPPGLRGAFTAAFYFTALITTGTVALISLRRPMGTRRRTARVVIVLATLTICTGALYASLSSLAIREHQYYAPRRDVVLVPLQPYRWAQPRLDSLVTCARFRPSRCHLDTTLRKYSTADVADAVSEYGPGYIEGLMSPTGVRLTIALLLILGLAAMSLFSGTLTFLGLEVAKRRS
jgi:hypothetical protein